jgi:hypothetical protein
MRTAACRLEEIASDLGRPALPKIDGLVLRHGRGGGKQREGDGEKANKASGLVTLTRK